MLQEQQQHGGKQTNEARKEKNDTIINEIIKTTTTRVRENILA